MADTVKTRAQLIERAGVNLGLMQPGEALSAEDYATLDNLVDPVIELMADDSVIVIADSENIELSPFIPLAAVLANYAGPSFGTPINDAALERDKGTLRRISATRPNYSKSTPDYY